MKNVSYIYCLGIGGIGMSALARFFHQQNKRVWGYDHTATPLTTQLIAEGIPIHYNDAIAAIPAEILQHPDQSWVIYTPALPPTHAIMRYLREKGVVMYKRAEVLGLLTQAHTTIAVAGTHGKTTTAALIAHILYQAKQPFVAFLGGIVQDYATNLLMHEPESDQVVMVVEADEFDRSFLQLRPSWSIVTAIDEDHMEIYHHKRALEEAFQRFLQQTTQQVIVQAQVAQRLAIDTPGQVTTYALQGAPIRAMSRQHQTIPASFDYVSPSLTLRQLVLSIPGSHNIENALAAITACLGVGSTPDDIRQGLKTFPGIHRRFEYVLQRPTCIFIDDYAHHPVEINSLLQAIRDLYPNKRITAIFQPHLYSRTQHLAHDFAASLAIAHHVFLLPIYPAREAPIAGVSTHLIQQAMPLLKAWLYEPEQLLACLQQQNLPEILVTIGAGDISLLVEPIKNILIERLMTDE